MSTCTDTCCRPSRKDQIDAARISQQLRRARKDYTCDYCSEPIAAGSAYWRSTWKVEGEIRSVVSHSPEGQCG